MLKRQHVSECGPSSAHLLILPSADDSVQAIESSRCNKQNVGGVHLHCLSPQLPGVFLWDIHYCSLQQLQQTLWRETRPRHEL